MGRDRARPRNHKHQVVLRRDLMRLFNQSCILCGVPIQRHLTVEHLIPLTRGGTDKKENLAPAHWVCNYVRGSASFLWAATRLEKIRKIMGEQDFLRWVHAVPRHDVEHLPGLEDP